MNIYLSGMIGSGKTTIGRMVSRDLGLGFVDLDQEMDRRLGHSFHDLVRDRGWLPFRVLEYEIIRDFAQLTNHIVCLGGGTIRYPWNQDLIRASGPVILFEASEDELIRRVSLADRPRVNQGTTLEDDIRTMWRDHAGVYRSTADRIVSTDGRTAEDERDEVISLITDDPLFRAIALPGGRRG